MVSENNQTKLTQPELDRILKNHERWLDSLSSANEIPRFFNSEEKGERANLSGLDLSGLDLKRANLTMADLSGANLEGVVLAYANLSETDLTGVNLNNADLAGVNLRKSNLANAKLENVNLKGANLFETELTGANMQKADLEKVNLEKVSLDGADLRDANLKDAKFYSVKMNSADLKGANLDNTWMKEVNFINANLERASLHAASLNHVVLDGASLKNANLAEIETDTVFLTNADLEGAKLDNAYLVKTLDLATCNLKDATLKEANLSGVDLRWTNLTNVCLTGANLENVNLKEAKLIQTDLSGTNLRFANLEKAYFETSRLDGADLRKASLENAKLYDVSLNSSNLANANLKKADLEKTNLEGAILAGAKLSQTLIPEKYKRIAELSNTAIASGMDIKRSTAMDYKIEAAKLINKAQRWLGLESDAKIAQVLFNKGHREKQIQNVIVSFSPETAGKSLVEAFKYSYQVVQKTMSLISEVSNSVMDAKKNREATKDYKSEFSKMLAQGIPWTGQEMDVKIAQTLLLQGHKKEYIQNVIAKLSPEAADKSPTEAFRYSLDTVNKVSAIQDIPVKNISEIFEEKIKENVVKIDQGKNSGNDIKNLALENQDLKNLKTMIDKVSDRDYPVKIVGVATPENVMVQKKEIGKQVSAIRSKEKENVQELDKDKGR